MRKEGEKLEAHSTHFRRQTYLVYRPTPDQKRKEKILDERSEPMDITLIFMQPLTSNV